MIRNKFLSPKENKVGVPFGKVSQFDIHKLPFFLFYGKMERENE